VGELTVTAYAQDLGTLLLEPAVVLPEQGDLVGSTTGEIEDVKGQDHIFLPLVLAQADPLAILREKAKVGSSLSYFCRHRCSSLYIIHRTCSLGKILFLKGIHR
jgi:hypothetical protein